MVTREEIVAQIQKVPEQHLDKLYSMVKQFAGEGEEPEPGESVMARLRQIKISAAPDFSIKANDWP